MRTFRIIFALFWLWIGSGLSCGQEIDRLLVAVNGHVITEGDLTLARARNAVLALGHAETRPTREEELDQLINLELTRQELENFPIEQGDQSRLQEYIRGEIDDLRQVYAEIGGLPALLSQLGLQEDELTRYIGLVALTSRFIDLRFDPFVTVTGEEVETYYRDELIPRLEKAGLPIPPLEEAKAEIDNILRKERKTAAYFQWIGNIRKHSRVEYFTDPVGSMERNRR